METLVITVHILACLFLIVVVLLQSGHEDMGVIFGGGSSSVFGSSGAGGILVKITTVLATVFLLTSLVYNVLITKRAPHASSIMLDQGGVTVPAPAPEKKPSVTFEEPQAKPQAPATTDGAPAKQ